MRAARLACLDPGLVGIRLDDFNNNGHIAVIHAAKLGALAAERASLECGEPRFVNNSRYCVLLDGEFRHPPRMNDVIGCQQQPDFLAFGHNERTVDVEQVVLDG